MKKIITLILLTVSFYGLAQQETIDQKVNTLLKKMTIEEKIGQLNQYTGDNSATGPITINLVLEEKSKKKVKHPLFTIKKTVLKYSNQIHSGYLKPQILFQKAGMPPAIEFAHMDCLKI